MFYQSVDEVLDYQLDWGTWLQTGDTIASSSWSADAGITINSETHTSTTTTVWVTGGSPEMEYVVTNTITTEAGRIADRSLTIHIRQRAIIVT